jgi:hypothetical protein
MDDDPVLRSLEAQLEHDDPRLAALLTGLDARPHPRRAWWLLLLVVPLLFAGTVQFGPAVLGVTAMVLGLAAPLVVGLWCLGRDDRPDAGPAEQGR